MTNLKKRRRLNKTYIFSAVLGAIIIATFIISLFARPGSGDNTADVSTVNPFITPTTTPLSFPTPEPNGPQLIVSAPTINNNGLFQVSVPAGWNIKYNDFIVETVPPRARITFDSGTHQSVIEMLVDVFTDAATQYPTLQALSDTYFTTSYFTSAWSSYTGGFTETGRTVDKTITVNFDLQAGERDYFGRQVAWLDGDWLHMVRIIVPNNYPALLDALTTYIIPTFVSYSDQRNFPLTWIAYRNAEQGFLIRHPNWRTVSRGVLEAPTLPAQVLLRSFENTPLATLDEAETYLTSVLRPDANVLSSQITSRTFASSGFLVSFTDKDRDGNPISGLVALLNDDQQKLYVAEMRLAAPNVDLLSLDADQIIYQDLRTIIDSFMVLPPVGYANALQSYYPAPPVITPTPTPSMTPEITVTPTQEITAEITQEATVEVTPEMTAESDQ